MEIAIDDYGSGYSNVNNLLRYMPEYVKIDRMLLTGIDADPHRQHFVKDIIEFTSTNDIKALAEGVETTKEMKTVIQLGAISFRDTIPPIRTRRWYSSYPHRL